jgi:molybdopterin-guanine dinucleotide biosynthesis protein B
MRAIGFAGFSGAGKTTLIVGLIPELNRRGLSVSTIKHAHHGFDLDQPGKDSYVHRAAGAHEVLVASANRLALMRELRGAPEPSLADLLRLLAPVDLVLVEGFKRDSLPKIEVHRAANGKPPIHPRTIAIVALISAIWLDPPCSCRMQRSTTFAAAGRSRARACGTGRRRSCAARFSVKPARQCRQMATLVIPKSPNLGVEREQKETAVRKPPFRFGKGRVIGFSSYRNIELKRPKMKVILALTFAGAGFIAGLRAAWLWWRASGEKPTISWNQDAWRDIQDAEWIVALLGAVQASGKLNGQAAIWTAASVVLNAVSTCLGAWPTSG